MNGWTQNPNESIHSKLWIKCPKHKFFGFARVLFATRLTTLEHNFGHLQSNLMVRLFGTSSKIEHNLSILDEETKRSKDKEKKKKVVKNEEHYSAGAF